MNRSSTHSYRVWATSSYWKILSLLRWSEGNRFFQQKMMILYVEVVPASSSHNTTPLIEPEVFRPFFKRNLCNLHPLWRTSGRVATAWPPWWLWVPGPQQKCRKGSPNICSRWKQIYVRLDYNYQNQWILMSFGQILLQLQYKDHKTQWTFGRIHCFEHCQESSFG